MVYPIDELRRSGRLTDSMALDLSGHPAALANMASGVRQELWREMVQYIEQRLARGPALRADPTVPAARPEAASAPPAMQHSGASPVHPASPVSREVSTAPAAGPAAQQPPTTTNQGGAPPHLPLLPLPLNGGLAGQEWQPQSFAALPGLPLLSRMLSQRRPACCRWLSSR